ncbi:MAG: MBL fold metallo-hydrolase [Proteobacteria bacterium]|nr:MBL fold metallo-hydrolase [Pseudomonadota bacterium]
MKITKISKTVRRITANNPGVMTGGGTNTYLIGSENITVIDPGPPLEEHVDNIVKMLHGKLKRILVTHTHLDHSPAAYILKKKTGAPIMGMMALHEANQDPTFNPDKILEDGDKISEIEYTLRVLHTPGHASNHLCYILSNEKIIFTGDHIMNGSTVVIAPPDGDMSQYLNSLNNLLLFDLDCIAPGHGDVMKNPKEVVENLIKHRLNREKKVIDALSKMSRANLDELVKEVYRDVNKGLYPIAKYSLQAHLIKLMKDGKVAQIRNEFLWRC